MIKKDWVELPPHSQSYKDGVNYFLDIAFTKGMVEEEEILCPCSICCNDSWEVRDVVYDHLCSKGFVKGYTEWIYHGEDESLIDLDGDSDNETSSHDDIDGLLFETFKDVAEGGGVHEGINEDAKKFYKLVDDANQELYPGCEKFSSLSFTIRIYLLKCIHGWSNASFTALVELLKEAMPNLNIPVSFNKTKSMIKDLGLDYKKIDACPNNCMLFWKDHGKDDSCHICGTSRWIEYPEVANDLEESIKAHKVPAKVLRHFPLIPSKKKDHAKARLDLQHMGIRKKHHLKETSDVKLPDGLASNISRCVQVNEGKVSGYKSHDAHIILHYLLQVAIRGIGPNQIVIPLLRLCSFFRCLCQKVVDVKTLDYLEVEIAETLCQFEHTRMNRMTRNSDDTPNIGHPIGGKKLISLDHKSLNQAHGYILFNCDEVQEYIREHEVNDHNPLKKRKSRKANNQREDFIQWFETRLMDEKVTEWFKVLSRGPNDFVRRYSGYVINGYRFHTTNREARLKTQNSVVTLEAVTQVLRNAKDENPKKIFVTYYGAIKDIIELDYYGHEKYVLFKCDWFVDEKDKYGSPLVYFNKKCYKNDPFVLASQVQQCFFIEDPLNKNKHYVLNALPRESFDMGESLSTDAQEYDISTNLNTLRDDCEVDLVRKDFPDEIFEIPLSELHNQKAIESDHSDTSYGSDDETDYDSSTD
ncbi:unnamed protein product [Vicia faba]|uniref:Transposase-associated domain-containing protein n=1 Tax=Vicia faba TaxID=3906 RepID=A0AAV0YZQ7_VICFA|nr:unnamed protein product [Vicia faba]